MEFRVVERLETIAARYVSMNMNLWNANNFEQIRTLPPYLKDRILKIFMLYYVFGPLSMPYRALSALVHSHTKKLSFTGAVMHNKLLSIIDICEYLEKIEFDCLLMENLPKVSGLVNFFRNKSNLTVILFRQALPVNDSVLKNIAKNCPKLRVLSINSCPNVGDKGLGALSVLKNLHSLNISYTKVTDRGISRLLEGPCKESLKELLMNSCKNITDETLYCIAEHCPNIQILSFSNCGIGYEAASLASQDKCFLKNLKQMTWTVTW